LRDYDVRYPSTNGSSDGVTSDPYFGTKIAGGYYVSGEGPYIEHIGQYYYLFVSYGGFAPGGYDKDGKPQGGYEMRVFRSQNPNGPYKDGTGRSAIFDSYVLNYGAGTDTRGMKLLGSYNKWGFMTVGECAQGHNSIIAAEDGRTYLVYHTKFNDGTAGHKVRVHQVFLNKLGWLVAAPFEYNGEELTDNDVATRQIVADSDILGTYQVLFHKYKMDYANFEEVTPVELTLTADGKVTGARTGTWTIDEGTSYLKLTLNNVTYNGVLIEEQIDNRSIKTISFSAISSSGVSVWGYKYRSDYAVAWQVNNQKLPVTANAAVKKNIDLYGMNILAGNIDLQWTSSEPQAISDYGKYYPIGLEENVNATLTARITSGNYFWQQAINVKVQSETNAKPIVNTWADGMLAHYKFDDASALVNSLDNTQTAQLLHNSTTKQPDINDQEKLRNGSVVHTYQAAIGKESYVAMPNPLKGKELTDGATIAFFVKRADNNLWDALFGCTSGTAKLFFTGNLYAGFNQGKSSDNSWLDINNPDKGTNADLGTGQWHHVIMTFQRTATSSNGGITIYVDGVKHTDKYNGLLAGNTISTKQGFNYNLIVDHLAACDQLFIGNGSYWGSADACFDDFMVYDRALSLLEASSLNQMIDRADTDYITDGIEELPVARTSEGITTNSEAIYDLSGRRVLNVLKSGLYIRGGKKIFVK